MKIAVLTFLCLACSTSGFQKSPSSRVNFYLSQKSNAASFPSESEVTRSQELTPADFIRLSKEYLADPSEDRLAEDFVFRGPLIGPIVKKDYFSTIKSVAVDQDTAFPDMQLNAFGFTCDDPIEPTRVWYFIRRRATFKGSFKTGVGITMQPTGKKFIGPPEARSFVFNEQGKIKHYSIGYVTDRFTGDTTGGMGAIFGMYEVVGIPVETLSNVGNRFLGAIQKVSRVLPGILPMSVSAEKDIPSWWKDKRRGNEK